MNFCSYLLNIFGLIWDKISKESSPSCYKVISPVTHQDELDDFSETRHLVSKTSTSQGSQSITVRADSCRSLQGFACCWGRLSRRRPARGCNVHWRALSGSQTGMTRILCETSARMTVKVRHKLFRAARTLKYSLFWGLGHPGVKVRTWSSVISEICKYSQIVQLWMLHSDITDLISCYILWLRPGSFDSSMCEMPPLNLLMSQYFL